MGDMGRYIGTVGNRLVATLMLLGVVRLFIVPPMAWDNMTAWQGVAYIAVVLFFVVAWTNARDCK